MLKRGDIVGNTYVIKEKLGSGSTGKVFLAESNTGKKLYTLKESENTEVLKREARLLIEIQSKYFPEFVDYVEEDNCGYLVLEYVEGVSLQQILDGGRRFKEKEVLTLMEEITMALSQLHYHRTPIVHLDIKPDNVLITTSGEVRIVDMGAGSVIGEQLEMKGGTYGYGAPEQFWQGVLPGAEADVYACGKLMAYLLTGKNPCQPPYDVEKGMLRSFAVRKDIRQVIMRCLEMEPERRYPDGGILHREIRRLQEETSVGDIFRRKREAEVIYVKSLWKSDYVRC